MEIIPSIVPQDIMDIESKLKVIEALPEGLTSWAHIDIADGKLAKNTTWPYTRDDDMEGAIREFADISTKLKVGLHMMVSYPEDFLDQWIDSPVTRILIHDEAFQNIESILAIIDMSKTESGVVLKMETDLNDIDEVINNVDVIQLMSIDKIGGYGASFNSDVFDRVKEVKKKYKDKPLIVDGGVNESNIKELADLGVDYAVVGSALWAKGDLADNITKLKSLTS